MITYEAPLGYRAHVGYDAAALRDVGVTAGAPTVGWVAGAVYVSGGAVGIVEGATVWVHLPLTSPVDISADTVEVSTDLVTWQTAEHETGGAKFLYTFPAGVSRFYSRITDSPEIPVLYHGALYAAASE